jgi:hypothetical protein
LLELAGYTLPFTRGDMKHFDDLLSRYRALTRPDQMVLRRRMLWHLLGLRPQVPIRTAAANGQRERSA